MRLSMDRRVNLKFRNITIMLKPGLTTVKLNALYQMFLIIFFHQTFFSTMLATEFRTVVIASYKNPPMNMQTLHIYIYIYMRWWYLLAWCDMPNLLLIISVCRGDHNVNMWFGEHHRSEHIFGQSHVTLPCELFIYIYIIHSTHTECACIYELASKACVMEFNFGARTPNIFKVFVEYWRLLNYSVGEYLYTHRRVLCVGIGRR